MAKILVVTANSRTHHLNLREESRIIRETLEPKGNYRIRDEWEASIFDLIERLKIDRPEILHFAGHGLGNGQQALILCGNDGNPVVLTANDLSLIFTQITVKPKLVVLNACSSAELIDEIAKHADVVIGMDGRIQDRFGLLFARHFYSALGNSYSVMGAYELTRMQLNKDWLDYLVIKTKTNVDPDKIIFYGQPELLARFALESEKPITDKRGESYNIILSLRGVDHDVDSATFQICDNTFSKKDRFWEIQRSQRGDFKTDDFWTNGDVKIRFVAWSCENGVGGESTVSGALKRYYTFETPPIIEQAIKYISEN